RGSSRASISESSCTGVLPASGANRCAGTAAAADSVKEFQASQCGHLPNHFGDVPPHSEQTKLLRAFAIPVSVIPWHAVATIHSQHLAGNEGGLVVEEEGDG